MHPVLRSRAFAGSPAADPGYHAGMSDYLQRRRDAAARAWALHGEVVLVAAGDPIPLPGGADQTYPYRPHNEYLYLADRSRPGSVLAYDPDDGWIDFVPEITQDERVWEGGGVDEGVAASRLPDWFAARRGRSLAVLGSPLPGIEDDPALRERLREQLMAVRRPKDEEELSRMRRAAAATAAGHTALPSIIRPGMTERDVRIELEAAFQRGGADRVGYGTIVGSGPNAAVLHFEPSQRRIAAGEVVLVDAGSDVGGYVCDVTRTYPAGGPFTAAHRDVYQVVLAAQVRAVDGCRAGVEFRELHLGCARDMAQGLADLGLLRCGADEAVETGAIALFFPHGLGHLVGLGVRDASGYLPGRQRSSDPVLRFLRVDMPLEPGFVTTIEPGLYVIPALLDDAELRRRHAHRVDWDRVDGMRDFGGVRIEDNVLVTEGEPEVLTAAMPKDPDAVAG